MKKNYASRNWLYDDSRKVIYPTAPLGGRWFSVATAREKDTYSMEEKVILTITKLDEGVENYSKEDSSVDEQSCPFDLDSKGEVIGTCKFSMYEPEKKVYSLRKVGFMISKLDMQIIIGLLEKHYYDIPEIGKSFMLIEDSLFKDMLGISCQMIKEKNIKLRGGAYYDIPVTGFKEYFKSKGYIKMEIENFILRLLGKNINGDVVEGMDVYTRATVGDTCMSARVGGGSTRCVIFFKDKIQKDLDELKNNVERAA